MAALRNTVQYETRTGQPIEIANAVVTPVSKVLTLTLPYYNLVWNRPVAVIVDQGDSKERLPIVDVMLLVRLLMLAVGLVTFLLALISSRARKRDVTL